MVPIQVAWKSSSFWQIAAVHFLWRSIELYCNPRWTLVRSNLCDWIPIRYSINNANVNYADKMQAPFQVLFLPTLSHNMTQEMKAVKIKGTCFYAFFTLKTGDFIWMSQLAVKKKLVITKGWQKICPPTGFIFVLFSTNWRW